MIEPLIYFLSCVFCIFASGFIPFASRPLAVSLLGLIFITALSPASSVVLLVVLIAAYLMVRFLPQLDRKSRVRKYFPYLMLLTLFWVDFHRFALGYLVGTVGVSFAIIRIFMTTKQLIGSKEDVRSESANWLFVSAFYLPVLIVGPVFSSLEFRKQITGGEEYLGSTSRLYRKMFQGLILVMILLPLSVTVSDKLDEISASGHSLLYPILLFVQLFFAFWGQSLIAENTSRLIGLDVPTNFNKPWRAIDIKDFWQRWHISMARFVMQYIYLPLNLAGVSPRLATICSFCFMGLWHEVKIGYLIWGIGHGLLLSYWPSFEVFGKYRIYFERTVLFISVVGLSYVANYLFK